jgi:hypothetical protein
MSAPTILPDRFTWTELANLTMKKRDHYMRDAIKAEFDRAIAEPDAEGAKQKHVQVDAQGRWFVTPVANYRYSVVWHCDEGQKNAYVDAVVPAYFAAEKKGNLMEQVREVVKAESGKDLPKE